MLKRKDWLLFKEREGEAEAESSDDGSEAQERISSDSEEESSSEGGDQDSDEDQSQSLSSIEEADVRRLEDLSEDEFDGNEKEAAAAEASSIKEQWLAASKTDAANLPRGVLSCRLCKGTLLLGPVSLRQHLGSKRHEARVKHKAADYEPICLAAKQVEDSGLETHRERLIRIKLAAEQPSTGIKKNSRALKRERKLRKEAKKAEGKPGKRERAELRTSGGVTKVAKKAKSATQQLKRKKVESKPTSAKKAEPAKQHLDKRKEIESRPKTIGESPPTKKCRVHLAATPELRPKVPAQQAEENVGHGKQGSFWSSPSLSKQTKPKAPQRKTNGQKKVKKAKPKIETKEVSKEVEYPANRAGRRKAIKDRLKARGKV